MFLLKLEQAHFIFNVFCKPEMPSKMILLHQWIYQLLLISVYPAAFDFVRNIE